MNFGGSKVTRYVVAATLFAAGQALAADELDLAIKMGCISCHRGAQKLIGPPYQDVAEKYAGRKDAVAVLADHIVRGTGPDGVGWLKAGKASLPFMPPNDSVKPQEAERLANWVLAMKGEIPGLMDYVTNRLLVTGAVEHPLDLSVDELRKLPASETKEIALESQSPAKAGKVEVFSGVLLRTLLEKAKVTAPGRHDLKKTIFVARASDDYAVVFTWAEVFNTDVGDGVLVVVEKDGKPLREDEGRIALISAKDIHRGARHVRWLKAIDVRKVAD
jgi:cytochrome c551/c552